MNIRLSVKIERLLKLAGIAIAVILGLLVFYRLCYYLAPFVIAFILATLMEPLIRLLVKKVRLPRKLASPLSLLLIVSLLGLLLFLIISKLIDEIVSISKMLPQFFTDLYNNVESLLSKAADLYGGLPPELTANVGSLISGLSTTITNIVNTIVKGLFSTAVSLPETLIFIIITLLSTYFLTSDRERILGFFRRQLPESWINKITNLKEELFSALFGYLRAQLILMSITFTELFIGFTIINIKYSLLLALLISLIDALPILGTGTVLIPWGIYSLLTGNIRMGVSVLIIYVIVLIVRQMIEPKVVGHQIGVYPLLTLVAMYAGLQLLGFIGLILGPVTVLILKNVFSEIFRNRTLREMLEPPENKEDK